MKKSYSSPFPFACLILLAACAPTRTVSQTQVSTQSMPDVPIPSSTPTFLIIETSLPPTPTPIPLSLTSTAFAHGDVIPEEYAHQGGNISPELAWSEPPVGTRSFALLVVSDPMPDGGEHWVLWAAINIPPDILSLPEGVEADENGRLPNGGQLLENSYAELKYSGPSPLQSKLRAFHFYIFALDDILELDFEAEKEAARSWYSYTEEILLKAIDGHVLAKGHLVGKYRGE